MLTALIAAALQLGATAAPDGTVRGVVRSDATGAPIAGARVEAARGRRADGPPTLAATDARGAYVLRGVPLGVHRLRFAATGYDTLAVDVLLAGDAPLHLDVALAPAPAPLAPVRVLARAGITPAPSSATGAGVGAWRVSGAALRQSPAFDDPDPLQLLATAPQAQMLPEAQGAVHVRGGSADHNRFLLDGAPVYSPVHAGPVPSAFNPDIVDALQLVGGAPPARYGGHLSSVVDVRTPAGLPDAVSTRGAFGPTSVRGAVAAPLLPGRAGLLVAIRHSYSGLRRGDAAEVAMPGTWSDSYAKLTLRVGDDDVTLSSFTAENGLGFPATTGDAPPAAAATTPLPDPRNRFDWTSATQAVAWRHPLGARTTLDARAWIARLDAAADWHPDGTSLALRSTFRDAGLAAVVTRIHSRGTLAVGLEAARLDARYAVAPPGTDAAPAPSLHLDATPALRSAFLDEAWHPDDAWTVAAGLRATAAADGAPRLEPRLSVAFHPSPGLALSLGYARLHQYGQSLRNEESLLGTLIAPDYLVAAGAPGVPVAGADEAAAAATLSLGPHTRITLDAYARRLRDLLLVAPATTSPFATRGFAVGHGSAWGAGVAVERRLDRLTLQSHYAVGTVTRRTPDTAYHPGFAPGHSASLALGWRLGRRTTLRSALWAAAGRRTTPLADDLGWDTRDAFSGERELGGTPDRTVGPLDGTRLPAFLRVDVGVRHTLALWRGRGSLAATASVSDVLGRENVIGYAASPTADDRRPLAMLPPSLHLGVAWGY